VSDRLVVKRLTSTSNRTFRALWSRQFPRWLPDFLLGARHECLTLNSVLQPIAGNPAAVLATSTLLIVAPGAPPQLQSVSAITQLVVKIDGASRIARRTVHLLLRARSQRSMNH
jgi:hypothetical protein